MNAAESTIAENHHHVVRADQRRQPGNNGIGIRLDKTRPSMSRADRLDQPGDIEPVVGRHLVGLEDFRQKHAVCCRQGGGQLLLKHFSFGGIRARLEQGPEPGPGLDKPVAQRLGRFPNGRWMMAKVIDNHHSSSGQAPYGLAAGDTEKGGQTGADLVVGHTSKPRRTHRHRGIPYVDGAVHWHHEWFPVQAESHTLTGGLDSREAVVA